MKITVTQAALSRGLSTVSHAVSSRSTLPILSNILVEAENDEIKLSATDLEKGITCTVPGTIQEDGKTTIPAKTFSDLVSSLRSGDVQVIADVMANITIKATGSNATIRGFIADEYPTIPTVNAEDSNSIVNLDVRQLKEMIAYTAFSAADDDARPVLTGVHVETTNEKLTFAAADAFRLAVMSAPLPSGEQIADTILIPAKTLTELARILPNEGTVQMIVTPNRSQVLFHTEHVDLVSRLIEGTFPNFRGIIPKEHTTRCVVDTKEFAHAVKTVTPFARDSSNIARIKINAGSEDGSEASTLTIEATAEDIGSNVSTINASVDGPEQEIIFNVKYLSDVLSALDTSEVALELVSAARPGVVKPVGPANYTYIIMPMSQNR